MKKIEPGDTLSEYAIISKELWEELLKHKINFPNVHLRSTKRRKIPVWENLLKLEEKDIDKNN